MLQNIVDLIKFVVAATFVGLCIAGELSNAMQVDSGDNKHIYLQSDGKQIDAVEAFKQAIADKRILDCSPVEAVANQRTGKVTLKKVK